MFFVISFFVCYRIHENSEFIFRENMWRALHNTMSNELNIICQTSEDDLINIIVGFKIYNCWLHEIY